MILLTYLVKVSAFTLVFYLIYHSLLRNETYYHLNRWYLISSLLISFILPLVSITVSLQSAGTSVLRDLSQVSVLNIPSQISGGGPDFSSVNWILIIYFTGVVSVTVFGLYDFYVLWKIRSGNRVIKEGRYQYIVNEQLPSFSFFRWIYIKDYPTQLDETAQLVLKHEQAHSRHWHSADILLLQLLQSILWFNPLIHLYKKSLQQIHEYQADQVVLAGGTDLRSYIQSIMEEIMHNRSYKLASHFKNSQIKKRVIMATKNSSHSAGWKYLLVLPVLVTGLLSFSFALPQGNPETVKDNPPSIFPIEKAKVTKVSQDFGGGTANDHPGIDFAAPVGTPIMATASGLVKKAGEKGDYGNLIYIVHDEHFATLYAHLSKFKVKEGEKVEKGQVIGFVGSTGKSTAPHLHYEVRIDGEQVNPKKFLVKQ